MYFKQFETNKQDAICILTIGLYVIENEWVTLP